MNRWLAACLVLGAFLGAGCQSDGEEHLERFASFMQREGIEGRLIGHGEPGMDTVVRDGNTRVEWEGVIRLELYARPGIVVRAYKFPDAAWAQWVLTRQQQGRVNDCHGGGRIGCYIVCQETADVTPDAETATTMGRVVHSAHFDAEALGCPPEPRTSRSSQP